MSERSDIKRAFAEFLGLRKLDERVKTAEKKHQKLAGDVRNMRQRVESLKRLVAGLRDDREANKL